MNRPDLITAKVHGKLMALRRAIRTRLAGHGLAWVVIALAGLVVVTLLCDWGLHRLTHQPVGRGQRALIALLSAAGVGYVLWRQLLWRVSVPLRDDDLALLVERHYHQLGDRLISALQFSTGRGRGRTGASPSMIAIVADQANAAAAPLDFLAPLNARPLWRRVGMAAAATAVIAGLWLLDADTMNRWFRRNILLADERWPQETHLRVEGGPVFSVMRGQDLAVAVSVEPRSKVVPEKVVFHIRYSASRKDERTVTLTYPAKVYPTVFEHVTEPFVFWVTGHDYRSEDCQVNVIQPAELTGVKFHVQYPNYTRLGSGDIDGAEKMLRLPPHTWVTVTATSTKELASAKILLDGMVVGEVKAPKAGQSGHELRGVFRIVPGNADKLMPLLAAPPFTADSIASLPVMTAALAAMSRRPETMQLGFALTDTDGYPSDGGRSYPVYLRYDKAPTLTVQWLTQSKSITPNAIAVMTLDARDEFGVSALHALVTLEGISREPLEIPLWSGPPVTQAPLTEATVDLKELGLHVGDVLTLAIRATDSRPNPNVSTAGNLRLVVVSEKELQEQLLARQREMSRHMNSALQAQVLAIDRMRAARDQADAGGDAAELNRLATESARDQQTVDSYAGSIVENYQRIKTIVIHNRLEKLVNPARLERLIIRPLADNVREPIPAALAEIDAAGNSAPSAALAERVDEILRTQHAFHRQLVAVQREMEHLKGIQELARMLSEVIAIGQEVREGIQQRLRDERGALFDPTSRPSTRPTGPE